MSELHITKPVIPVKTGIYTSSRFPWISNQVGHDKILINNGDMGVAATNQLKL